MKANPKKNKIVGFDAKVIILLIIITLIIAYFLIFKDLFKDKNIKMEEEMVEKAKDYVLTNNINTTKEIYLDSSKLNIKFDDDCSFTSGVIFDGISYIPNLICQNYKSKVIDINQNVKDYIELIGDEIMFIAKGMSFYEPGYISNDIVDVIGNVGTEEGIYNLYYKTKNSNKFALRKVIILDNQELRDLFPTIKLNGDELITILEGNKYNELGIIGTDNVDGDISSSVKIDGKVDTMIPGEYKITYILTNSRGYSNIITRKVTVISKNSDLTVNYLITPESLTNSEVTIKLSINGIFDKIVYPDGKEGKELTYIVNENGTYKFSVYDTYDRVIIKEIEINNIDKTVPQGTCVATTYYNRTEVNVNITTSREISSYEYIINNISSNSSQTTTYVSDIVKPSTVKVRIKDIINNQNEITCTMEDKLTRNIVTNEKGKNCLEGMTCYVQFDYGNASKYPYCSMSNNPNSCGGIGRNGCSITSASNAIAAMGVKSSSGALYNPYTVWEELYPINKKTGQCNGGCSGWTRIRDAVVAAGLTATRKVESLNKSTVSTLLEHLRKGYPAVVWADTGAFTKGRHYMSILGIREDGYVFLSDSANQKGIEKSYYKGKQYYVDTWISTDDLISGGVKQFLLVGPAGMYEGK